MGSVVSSPSISDLTLTKVGNTVVTAGVSGNVSIKDGNTLVGTLYWNSNGYLSMLYNTNFVPTNSGGSLLTTGNYRTSMTLQYSDNAGGTLTKTVTLEFLYTEFYYDPSPGD